MGFQFADCEVTGNLIWTWQSMVVSGKIICFMMGFSQSRIGGYADGLDWLGVKQQKLVIPKWQTTPQTGIALVFSCKTRPKIGRKTIQPSSW